MTDRTAAEVMCCPDGCDKDTRSHKTCCAGGLADLVARLHAAGYMIVPREPSTEMLQDGFAASRSARHPGVSGMTIDAQTQAQAYREMAIYRAMTEAGELE